MKTEEGTGGRKGQTEPSGGQNDQGKRAQMKEEVAQGQRRDDGGAKCSRHDRERPRRVSE